VILSDINALPAMMDIFMMAQKKRAISAIKKDVFAQYQTIAKNVSKDIIKSNIIAINAYHLVRHVMMEILVLNAFQKNIF
jgi:hypothetical protein